MTSNNLSIVIPDFFVHPTNKPKGSGSGEAKLYLGLVSKEAELDDFFNNFDSNNKYYLKKSNLLKILENLKLEFIFQTFRKYENLSLAAWEDIYSRIQSSPHEELEFQAIKYLATGKGKGAGQYFLTSTDTKKDVWGQILRKVCLSKLTILQINKIQHSPTQVEYFFEVVLNTDYPYEVIPNDHPGYNKIIYGAPGAGKSATVNKRVGKNYIRTVFHPETQYSDFIGCLKPHRDSSNGSITYSFRAGPFIQILELALLDPKNHYFLIIEELNRANTAAVFGEVFQLLDRDDEGKSEYPIVIQDADLYDYLKNIKELSVHANISKRELIIPSNLSIIATMNSSDQAVFPLDTAFKRRWIFEYLPIDFTNCARGEVPIHHEDLPNVEWKTLAQTINTILVQLKVVEDKLIGPWFIKDSDLVEGQAEQTFIGKICSYLWDDALKYKNKDEIFRSDIHGYGELYQRYSDQKPIFSDKFMEILQTTQDVDTDTSNKTEAE